MSSAMTGQIPKGGQYDALLGSISPEYPNVVPKNKSSLGVEIPNRIIDVKIFEPNLSKAELHEINQIYQKFKLETN